MTHWLRARNTSAATASSALAASVNVLTPLITDVKYPRPKAIPARAGDCLRSATTTIAATTRSSNVSATAGLSISRNGATKCAA